MTQTTATLSLGTRSEQRGGKRAFARHFAEMLLVMFAGMGVLGVTAELAFAAAGSDLSDQSGGLRVALMGVYMTVPMALWMGYRGHSRARNAEMAAAMMLPSLAAAMLAWTGALETMAAFTIQHVVMIPAMLGVMLWRYAEYSHRHGRG